MPKSWFGRYLVVVGIIVAAIIGLGVWLKPPADKMRETVEAGLTQFAAQKTSAGEVMPAVTHQETNDWFIAVSHVAKVGDDTFFCIGGFKITYCDMP